MLSTSWSAPSAGACIRPLVPWLSLIAALGFVAAGAASAQELDPEAGVGDESISESEPGEAEADRAAEEDAVDDVVEEAYGDRSIEEITVTAQRREESLQDVPISMSALSSTFIEDTGLTDFLGIQKYVPNLSINPVTDTRQTIIRVRGIGTSGFNAGFDPSVGIFVDGVYQGRAGMSFGDLLDIERIEVLRGPQGTLYGKNTAAGAINVLSQRPNYEYQGAFEAQFGNYNNFQQRGTFNLPLWDEKIATRFSAYNVDRDGFAENTILGEDANDENKWGLRSRTLFDVNDSFDVLISGDFSRQSNKCCVADILDYGEIPSLGLEPFPCPAGVLGCLGNPNLIPAGGQGVTFEQLAQAAGRPLPEADGFDFKVEANAFDAALPNVPGQSREESPKNKLDVWGASLEGNYEIAEHVITSLTAWRGYTSDSLFDGDFSGYDAVRFSTDEELRQWSSELRVTSPGERQIEYTGGLYYFYEKHTTVAVNTILPLLGQFFWLGGANGFPLLPDGQRNTDNAKFETTSLAAFGQATWNPPWDERDGWWAPLIPSVTAGLRYTWEAKSRKGSQRADPLNSNAIDVPPLLGPDIDADNSRHADNLSPMINLRWFPTDEIMVYGKWARGFKSGGFNQLRVQQGRDIEFDDEQSDSFELGLRTSWLDNRLTANITGFYTLYKDFQSQTFNGTTIEVRNAADLRSYGFEMDVGSAPIDYLTVGASVGFNIAEYEEFPDAECTVQQIADARPNRNPDGTLGVCPGQDLAGRPLDNAPRWTISSFAHYERPLPFIPKISVNGYARVDYSFRSLVYLAQDLDPNLKQDPVSLLGFRVGVRTEDDRWELVGWVDNALDVAWHVVGFDVPALSGYAGINAPPRTFGFTLRARFEGWEGF